MECKDRYFFLKNKNFFIEMQEIQKGALNNLAFISY